MIDWRSKEDCEGKAVKSNYSDIVERKGQLQTNHLENVFEKVPELDYDI